MKKKHRELYIRIEYLFCYNLESNYSKNPIKTINNTKPEILASFTFVYAIQTIVQSIKCKNVVHCVNNNNFMKVTKMTYNKML